MPYLTDFAQCPHGAMVARSTPNAEVVGSNPIGGSTRADQSFCNGLLGPPHDCAKDRAARHPSLVKAYVGLSLAGLATTNAFESR